MKKKNVKKSLVDFAKNKIKRNQLVNVKGGTDYIGTQDVLDA